MKTEDTALKEDVREAILDTASRLFQHYGYKKTTVEDIAREAGICRGTVYLYFRGKEEIALSWLERFNQCLFAELGRIAHSEGTAVQRLEAMLAARVLLRFDAAQPYAESLNDLFFSLRSSLQAQREQSHEIEAQIFAEVLEEGRVAGEFTLEDTLATARLFILTTNSLLPYSLSVCQLGGRQEIEAKTRGIAALLLNGVRRS